MIKQLFTQNSKFLADCNNLLGPLKDEERHRLLAVLNEPCQVTWEAAYAIVISKKQMTTLWQAVATVDGSFPRSRKKGKPWPRIPDQFTLCRAIRMATDAASTKAGRQTA